MKIMVEFPVEEARAMLKGEEQLTVAEDLDMRSGFSRLRQAVAVECGPSGNADRPLQTCTCGHPLDDHGQDGPMACLEEDCDCTDFRMFAAVQRKQAA